MLVQKRQTPYESDGKRRPKGFFLANRGKFDFPLIFCFSRICFLACTGSISLAVSGVCLFIRFVGRYTG